MKGWTEALEPEVDAPQSAPAPKPPRKAANGSVEERERARREAFASAALEGEIHNVRTAGTGTRNNTLNNAALKLGSLVASGALSKSDVIAALTAAAQTAGLHLDEIGKTIASGMKAGAKKPREIPAPTERARAANDQRSPPADEYEHTDSDAPGAASDEPSPPPKSGRASISISEVLTEWAQSGPLVHEPTGIPQLDELTGGGPVYGTRWYFGGSPDAGKTALLVQLAHVYAARGVTVGLLAVDEEAGDLVTRFAQRIGYSRSHCEIRDPAVLVAMESGLGALPIRIYDAAWTIEAAASDLAALAIGRAQEDPASHPHGPRAMLGVDSIQTVSCAADFVAAATGRELSEVSAVTARVRALRGVATQHRLIAIATSELGRGAYRSSDPAQQTSILAAGKWSGAIEYSARVLLGLRSVAGEQDLVEVEIAKNKHGPRDEKLYLRIDRRSQTLTPVAYDAPPEPSSADRDERVRDRVTLDAAAVARIIATEPGLGVLELRGAAKAAAGMGTERVSAALSRLGDALVKGTGPRGATPMTLDETLLDADLRRAMEDRK